MSAPRLPAALLFVLPVLFLSGCAKTGDPQPPRVRIPQPPADLQVRQYSDKATFTVSMPVSNTDGSPFTNPGAVEVFRLTEERTDSPHQWSDEEFIRRAELLLRIPADKFAGYARDGALVFHDDLAVGDRSLRFYYAVRFVNKRNETAGLSNQVYLAPIVIPAAPADLRLTPAQDMVRLSWTPPSENVDGTRPPRIAGYNVYRSEESQPMPDVPLNKELLQAPEFEDRNFQFDKTYHYAVSVIASTENPYAESARSNPVRIVTRDTFPPGKPVQLDAVIESGVVILLWAAPAETDVSGYKIHRQEVGAGDRVVLQRSLITTLSYRDETVQSGKSYEYEVAAVDGNGNEGPPAKIRVGP
jgi:hypothetical protein